MTRKELAATIDHTLLRADASPDDVFVSWLPIYHDMGLITMTMVPFYLGAKLVLLPTIGLNVATMTIVAQNAGAGLFGRIPHFTENRFMKWYKGVLGMLMGDLGPFDIGMVLAFIERLAMRPFRRRLHWRIEVDGAESATGEFQAFIVVNGHLGDEMAFSDLPLGSQCFDVFAVRDLGVGRRK